MFRKITAMILSLVLFMTFLPAVSADSPVITKLYAASESITILANSNPYMPATLLADYSDGRTGAAVPAIWAYVEPDNFDAARTIVVEGYTSGSDLAATLKIKVVKPSGAISSVQSVGEIVTTVGMAPVMPAYVLADYSSGETSVQCPITWAYIEPDNYDAPRTFYVEGYVAGTDLFITAIVKAVQPKKVIESVIQPEDVTTTVGKDPTLPKTVLVKYTDYAGLFPIDVTWAYVESDNYDAPRTIMVEGYLKDTDVTVTIKVIVSKPDTAKIARVYQSESVKTAAGTAPVLPATVHVLYDGQRKPAAVTVKWDSIDSSAYAKAGMFTVSGTVEGTQQKAKVNVIVYKNDNTVTKKTILKVHDIKTVKTTVGVAPVLPTYVYVTYRGSKEKIAVPVVWETVPVKNYSTSRSFTVKGTIAGTEKTVKVKVTVAKAVKSETTKNESKKTDQHKHGNGNSH